MMISVRDTWGNRIGTALGRDRMEKELNLGTNDLPDSFLDNLRGFFVSVDLKRRIMTLFRRGETNFGVIRDIERYIISQ